HVGRQHRLKHRVIESVSNPVQECVNLANLLCYRFEFLTGNRSVILVHCLGIPSLLRNPNRGSGVNEIRPARPHDCSRCGGTILEIKVPSFLPSLSVPRRDTRNGIPALSPYRVMRRNLIRRWLCRRGCWRIVIRGRFRRSRGGSRRSHIHRIGRTPKVQKNQRPKRPFLNAHLVTLNIHAARESLCNGRIREARRIPLGNEPVNRSDAPRLITGVSGRRILPRGRNVKIGPHSRPALPDARNTGSVFRNYGFVTSGILVTGPQSNSETARHYGNPCAKWQGSDLLSEIQIS